MVKKEALYQDRAEEHYSAAMQAFNRGESVTAVRHFRIASEYGFDRPLVRMRLAAMGRLNGRLRESMARLEELVPDNTFHGELFLHLGMVSRDLDKSQEARDYFMRALKESPLRWIRVEALRHLLPVVKTDRLGKLLEYASQGKKLPIDSIGYRRAELWIEWMHGDRHGAFLKLRELIREFPSVIQLYLDMALFSSNRRNNGMAITALRTYRKYFPREFLPSMLHARILFELGRYGMSSAILKHVVVSEKKRGIVFRNLAVCHLKTGMTVAAIRSYRKAIQFDPDDADAYMGLAVIYHQNGSLDTAEEYYRQAFILRPDDHRIVYNLGNLLYESGDYHNSIRSFQHALKLKPGFKPAENNLQFVMLAKTCYPEDGPEAEIRKRTGYYWIGVASAVAILLVSFFKGWI